MADLYVHRPHPFTLAQARAIAASWAEQAQRDHGLTCTRTTDEHGDRLTFRRAGVEGELCVGAQAFEMRAKLGFLLGAFKPRIEAEVARQLDALLGQGAPAGPAAAESNPSTLTPHALKAGAATTPQPNATDTVRVATSPPKNRPIPRGRAAP